MKFSNMSLLKKIRLLIVFFMIALILSGVTAFPVETELRWLLSHPSLVPSFAETWLQNVYNALKETNAKYPMLAYGYDWLAFAHIVIAMMFISPLRDPIKNIWVIEWGIISCIAVIPLAFIAGPIRHIPLYHILIDCSFGVIGIIPLWICRKWIKQLEADRMRF
jgi:hypothetical protein